MAWEPTDAIKPKLRGGGGATKMHISESGPWTIVGDLPPDMPRQPETWVSLYNY